MQKKLYDGTSKAPQKGQGSDPRPLWLLIRTPSVLGHVFAPHELGVAYSDGCLYRYFDILFLSPEMFV